MSQVNGPSSVNQITNDALNRVLGSEVIKQRSVGGGTTAQSGPAPAPSPANGATISDIRASMASLGLNMTQAQVDVLLVEVAISMRDTESKTQDAKIKNDQASVRSRIGEQSRQIDEMTAKIKEAKEAKESASIADKIKLAFEWLGAVIAVVVAVVAIATSPLTGGALAVVGALLIAAAVASFISAADSTVTVATGNGIGFYSAKSMGLSDEEARKHEQAFQVTVAVVGAVCGLAGGGVGIVSGVRSVASATFQLSRMAGNSIMTATREAMKEGLKIAWALLRNGAFEEGVSQSMKWASRGANIAEAANTIGTQAAGITSTAYKGVATMANADAKRAEANSKEEEALITMLNDAIDQAFTRLMAAGDRFNAVLDGIMEARNDRAQFTARAHFAG
ncbi:type III secretion system translocon subunit SctE [Aureimonas sp. AU4]|uniref:type III secretion system translocon subunit SctE n=1 Tax=Aureimonas sp. AU4 TaxID=1638163 RepID=UPI0007836EA3|nr:type III secretion system translocon subunit SctE [Aureimonas sp. AU4]